MKEYIKSLVKSPATFIIVVLILLLTLLLISKVSASLKGTDNISESSQTTLIIPGANYLS